MSHSEWRSDAARMIYAGLPCEIGEAVFQAQNLADMCCKKFGHDVVNEGRDCRRCGADFRKTPR